MKTLLMYMRFAVISVFSCLASIVITVSDLRAQQYAVNMVTYMGDCEYQEKMVVLSEIRPDLNLPLDTVHFVEGNGVFSYYKDTVYMAQKFFDVNGIMIMLDKLVVEDERLKIKERLVIDEAYLETAREEMKGALTFQLHVNEFLYWSKMCIVDDELALFGPDRKFLYSSTNGDTFMMATPLYKWQR